LLQGATQRHVRLVPLQVINLVPENVHA
jgi:hypothetical protein